LAWWKIGHQITFLNCNKLEIGKLEKLFKFPNKEDKWKIAKKMAWWIIGCHNTLENCPKNHKLENLKN
jgi:hypothetical protein